MTGSYEEFLKYVTLLNEGDLLDLFDVVKAEATTLSKAARRCGIERKTIYDMMGEGKQVKQKTKERILRAALKTNFEKSMAFLLSKALKESRDIYANYLSLIYQGAMMAKDSEEFKKAVSKFDSTIDRLLVLANIEQEVGSMTTEFVNKAANLGTEYIRPIPNFIDNATLSVTIPALIKDLSTNPAADVSGLAMKWRVSPVLVTSLYTTMKNMPMLGTLRGSIASLQTDLGGTAKAPFFTSSLPSRSNPEAFENLPTAFAENSALLPIAITQ